MKVLAQLLSFTLLEVSNQLIAFFPFLHSVFVFASFAARPIPFVHPTPAAFRWRWMIIMMVGFVAEHLSIWAFLS